MLGLRSVRRAGPTFRQVANRRYASAEPSLKGVGDNAFNRERAAVKAHAEKTADLWRKIFVYIAIPSIIIAGVNAWRLWREHWEHVAHSPPISERVQYPYMNIRTKKFPWGDGDKTLFWNDKVNYKPSSGGDDE